MAASKNGTLMLRVNVVKPFFTEDAMGMPTDSIQNPNAKESVAEISTVEFTKLLKLYSMDAWN